MTTTTQTRPEIESGTWEFDPAHTTFGFTARHLMVTKVRGHFDEFEGRVEVADDLTESRIELTLKTASITTGTSDRDDHLRSGDFLDVETYPELRFESTDISFDGDEWQVTGDLTIRDVTHPITFDVVYEGTATDPWGNERIAFSAVAKMTREDWDLTWNVQLESGGWLVSKDVSLEIEGQLIRS